MAPLLTILVLCTAQPVDVTKDGFAFREEYAFEGNFMRGEARLTGPRTVRIGEVMPIDLSYTHDGSQHEFFNPFFVRKFPLPAAIAVYDDDKNYLGDYLYRAMYSWTPGDPSSRTWIWSGGRVGTTISVRAGHMRSTRFPGDRLPPGKYHLQAVFYKGFVTFSKQPKAKMTLDEVAHFYDDFDRTELFRSNMVEIELTE